MQKLSGMQLSGQPFWHHCSSFPSLSESDHGSALIDFASWCHNENVKIMTSYNIYILLSHKLDIHNDNKGDFYWRCSLECAFVYINACLCTCCVAPVSPPPQQVEEDESNVEIEGEGSSDVFLWIQTIAHCPHQQLTVNHQELRQRRRGVEEEWTRWEINRWIPWVEFKLLSFFLN